MPAAAAPLQCPLPASRRPGCAPFSTPKLEDLAECDVLRGVITAEPKSGAERPELRPTLERRQIIRGDWPTVAVALAFTGREMARPAGLPLRCFSWPGARSLPSCCNPARFW